jgi:hypothetical protein
MSQCQKHIGHKSCFFLNGDNPIVKIIRQFIEFGYRVPADGFVAHGASF